MLRFTKRADYGLMAIHYIARNDGLGAVSTKRIAEEFGIPPELLAKILQKLAKRRLIVSQNGPKGGYVLTRRPGDISVGEVVRALEGPINIVSCLDHGGCDQPSARHHEPGRAERPERPRNTVDTVMAGYRERETERARWR